MIGNIAKRSIMSRARPAEMNASPYLSNAVTFTLNNLLSPDGRVNATRMAEHAYSDYHFIKRPYSGGTYASATEYIIEAYVKSYGGRQWVYMDLSGSTTQWAYFDIVNGVTGFKGAGVTRSAITSLGDGWFHIAAQVTGNGSSTSFAVIPTTANVNSAITATTGVATMGVYLWKMNSYQGMFPPYVGVNSTLRPASDSSAGSWTVTPLFSKVNDSSDATLMTCDGSTNSTAVLTMATMGGVATAATSVLTVRAKKDQAAGNTRNIGAVVKKSGSTIATLSAQALTESFQDFTLNVPLDTDLSTPGITVDLVSTGTVSGSAGVKRIVQVAEVYLTVTY